MSNVTSPWWKQWDPDMVTISDDSVSDVWKICVLEGVYFGENEYNGNLGARISSVFVILFVSTFFTMFPLISKNVKKLKIPLYAYSFAKYFGSGVIIATAFIHLMDPAYSVIGGNSCVGQTGNWALYSWCPAIMLASLTFTFLTDLFSSVWVERKYGVAHDHTHDDIKETVVDDAANTSTENATTHRSYDDKNKVEFYEDSDASSLDTVQSFQTQFYAFLILEFGVIFHSVMIGLNLGSTGKEFATLYPVLVFHQSFEGLGIGARLSAIEFPKSKRWWPWALCVAYGLTTPVCVAIGLGVRTKYVSGSYTASVISGVLDAISAGILLYTGLVELLARDFLFNPNRTKDLRELSFDVICTLFGAGIMALIGKWA
ncbi:zrt1p [Saccharomyces arboricola H-6]|uniref:Zrt1p n=1 Tax=Saccharomyces arboricola (strain H-6 / AS 2.3317 / CBS 10644) TaxID=1160507 RepID=J8Q5E0_SACAR|nr:zrt1p [Saccharomyces arboricola H-6]